MRCKSPFLSIQFKDRAMKVISAIFVVSLLAGFLPPLSSGSPVKIPAVTGDSGRPVQPPPPPHHKQDGADGSSDICLDGGPCMPRYLSTDMFDTWSQEPTYNWNEICRNLCLSGHGGSACRCNILP
uniref:Uncharacterized protein n=1 Tax=Timema shepardi TaxID=629360 RepID=A0A7R9AQ16_TIMSH|nr:unnamed protein product [Timema shepardi]